MSPTVPSCPTSPSRRIKPGYKSPAAVQHSKDRIVKYNLKKENLEILDEFYSIDSKETQFVHQNFYHRFVQMKQGKSIWKKIMFDKKLIVWLNPMNGFTLAVLKEFEREVKLPNEWNTFEDNLMEFKSIWDQLDYDTELLVKNIRSHVENDEYCCLECEFPFATICSELYNKFDPGGT